MTETSIDRRHFFGTGVAAVAGAALIAPTAARAQAASGWQPAADPKDAWMDMPGTLHRMAFDCTAAGAAGAGLGFANNFIETSRTGYGTPASQIGTIIIYRHDATPFAYNNAMWVKYGRQFAKMLKLESDEAIAAISGNPLFAKPAGPSSLPPSWAWMDDMYISTIVKNNVHFAVCGLATEGIAMQLAGKTGDAKAIQAELGANLIPNGHLMPSGIVAVNRAQEHGYAFAYVSGA
ncbi:MAG: hypothetical protein ABIO29_02030 [Sphingomicrobium sp.]